MTLNQTQKQAVEHSGSPLLLVAGPGSGKTRVIIERILHLVNSGTKPEEILCLTFTKKATEEMSERLENHDITDAQINTFHSFAKSVLQDNMLESGVNISSGVIKRSAQLAWGLKNIDSFDFQHVTIGNNAEDLIRSIIDGIRTFKDELITPDTLKKYLDEKETEELSEEKRDLINRLSDLHRVYVKYQEFWSAKSVIDFNDIVVEAINLLRTKPLIQQKIQKKYKHILVDEFQDNNYAQLELVKLISNDGNVTAVGDDDQSIFRFQGAYMKNFNDFEKYFTNTKVINLDQNYRSTQNIVNLSNSIVSNIEERQKKNLFSKNIEGNTIKVCACTNENAEVEYVVKTIKELLGKPITREDGEKGIISYGDIAILSRSRKSGVKFVKSLKAHGVPADFVGSDNLFATPIVKDVMAYLNIVNSPATAGREIARLLKNHGITEYNVAKINHFGEKLSESDNPNVDFVLKSLQEIAKQEITQKKEILEFVTVLTKLSELSKFRPSDVIYKIIMSISGLYKRSISDNTTNNRINQILLKEIYNYALEYETLYPDESLTDFISYLNYLFRFDLELPEELEGEENILVTTIHQSKGKEFQIVFVVDVAKDKFPLRTRTKKFYVPEDLAKGLVRTADEKTLHILDEKRLLYVAMTRAKSHLYITYAQDYENRKKEALPSPFLDEINFKDNPLIDATSYKSNIDVQLSTGEHLEQLKQEHQEIAVTSINQMNLDTAIRKIIDLAKIKHFEEFKNLDGFDPAKLFEIESEESHIDSQLYQKSIPLIRKDDFTSPSSVMPQKKNPDILELTRGKTSQVIGYLTSILTTTKGLPSGYSRDLQQIKSSIWSTSKTSITALIIIKSMLSDLTVNQEKMKKATEEGFLVALDLAENLVLEKIPFRSAHNIVGNLVQLSHNSKKLLSDLELDEIKSLGIKNIKPEKLFELIQKTTISSSLKQRKSKGSSGISEQTRMIGQRTRKLVTLKKSIKTQNYSVKKSLTLLEKRIKTLTK